MKFNPRYPLFLSVLALLMLLSVFVAAGIHRIAGGGYTRYPMLVEVEATIDGQVYSGAGVWTIAVRSGGTRPGVANLLQVTMEDAQAILAEAASGEVILVLPELPVARNCMYRGGDAKDEIDEYLRHHMGTCSFAHEERTVRLVDGKPTGDLEAGGIRRTIHVRVSPAKLLRPPKIYVTFRWIEDLPGGRSFRSGQPLKAGDFAPDL
mgnify:CR=1 FL=1|jgi:hypothetical protein